MKIPRNPAMRALVQATLHTIETRPNFGNTFTLPQIDAIRDSAMVPDDVFLSQRSLEVLAAFLRLFGAGMIEGEGRDEFEPTAIISTLADMALALAVRDQMNG